MFVVETNFYYLLWGQIWLLTKNKINNIIINTIIKRIVILLKDKVKILHYKCIKCNFNKDFLSNQQINTKCKMCGNEMIYDYSKKYNPNNGIKAIKHSSMNNNNTEFFKPKEPIVTCPYCHTTNVKKITTTSKVVNTAIFGIFGTKRHKQWHCNNCGSDF